MIGWILGAIAVGYVCGVANEKNKSSNEIRRLSNENYYLRLTINNHRTLLSDYDKINSFSKRIGFKGAVDFFYYLAEYHDNRFGHFARFLNKVKHVRNDVAHNGVIYNIDQNFLNKLHCCVEICQVYQSLSSGQRLYLG